MDVGRKMDAKIILFLYLISIFTHLTTSQSTAVISANTQFANKLYQELSKANDENIFFSPISAHAILSLIYQGAKGSTQKALASVLDLPEQRSTADGYKDVMSSLNAISDVTLHIANKIWLQNNFQLKKSFKALANDYFYAEADVANFDNAKDSARTINSWVEQKTHNKIKDLITEDMIDPATAMILVNAIYFKGSWLRPFPKLLTKKEKFHLIKRNTKDVNMMYVHDSFKYGVNDNLKAQILELPYINRNVSMLIILPNAIDGIQELEQRLIDVDLNSLNQGLHKRNVHVHLPKFKIETKIDLKNILTKIGLEIIFSDGAEFPDLLEAGPPLKVSDAVQKAFIEVNEEGAEAAAATALRPIPLSLEIPIIPDPHFTADHPFVILVRNKNNILFVGRINNP